MKKMGFILVGFILATTGVAGQPSAAQAASKPLCSKVWVKGHTLPKHYNGCRGWVVWTYSPCKIHATQHKGWLWAGNGMKIRTGKAAMNQWIDRHCY